MNKWLVCALALLVSCSTPPSSLHSGYQRRQQSLPGGNTAILNEGSVLDSIRSYAPFSCKLNGDALFRITNDSLLVNTKSLTITIRNGICRVNSFQHENGAVVEVLNGQATVQKNYASSFDTVPETLHAGEMALFNREIDLMEKETGDTVLLRRRFNNNLVFNKAPVTEVIKTLDDWYNITLNTTGNWDNVPAFSGSFHPAVLKEVLDALARQYKAGYTEQPGRQVLLQR